MTTDNLMTNDNLWWERCKNLSAKAVYKQSCEKYSSHIQELSINELHSLMLVSHEKYQLMEMSKILYINHANICRILRKLKLRGIITSTYEKQLRHKVYKLTPEGKLVFKRALMDWEDAEKKGQSNE